ncbi:hypothetical protein [Ekhidna sp.]|uniref:hypothetical protein n=1 Tax=Ekhidna sp. TaxID=2608089 RepID=UPI0032EC90B8
MKNSISLLFAITTLLLVQCKSANQTQSLEENQEAIPILLLLQDDLTPSDLEAIKSVKVESMKRISRSQNKWMVKIANEYVVNETIEKLGKDEGVIEVSRVSDEALHTPINSKSGKSGPIKN